MEIFAIKDDGVRLDAHQYTDGFFKCFPKSCNRVEEAKFFTELRKAAVFLVENPEWGIRMNPGMPIIYDGITIIRR
jgi:hypothetical protein